MHRFFEKVVIPLIENIGPKNIVEIGALKGDNTLKLLEYCQSNNSFLTSIDPFPQFDFKKIETENIGHFKMVSDLSLNALSDLSDVDLVLIDGDHNWYTVYNELQLIYKNHKDNFPIIFFHDIAWPYARRDLYYNPDNIPDYFRNPYEKKGMLPNVKHLVQGGINDHLCNAIYENNNKNGVLTAIEDFIDEVDISLEFVKLNGLNGFGICYEINNPIHKLINKESLLEIVLELTEKDRLLKQHKIIQLVKQKNKLGDIQLFIDTSSSFNEKKSIKILCEKQSKISFDLKEYKDIKALRFDPLNDYVVVNIKKILLNNQEYKNSLKTNAFYVEEQTYYFYTKDSNIFLDVSDFEDIKEVSFELEYLHIGEDAVKQFSNIFSKILESKNQNIQNLNKEVESKNQNIQNLNKEVESKNQNIQNLNKEVESKNQNIQNLNKEVESKNQNIQNLNKEVESKNQNIQNLNKEVESKNQNIQNLNKEVESKNQNIQNLNKEVESKNQNIQNLNKEVESKNQNIQNLNKEVESKNQNIQNLNKHIEVLKEELTLVYTSKSWQITRPIRKLKKILKGNKK